MPDFTPPPIPPEEDGGNMSFAQQAQQAIHAEVRMFSGCKDSQTSADVSNVQSFQLPQDAGPGGAGGACTNAMISVLSNNQSIAWVDLLRQMRKVLGTKGFEQIPQLSCSRKMDITQPFTPIAAQPSGRKKSLFIGINYVGQRGELRGCHNDVDSMQRLLSKYGFSVTDGQDCAILMDDGKHNSPTHANIHNAFLWLVQDAQPGDSLFMHYSGHGGYVRDENGDEQDKRDETVIPVDFQQNGQITDDEIFKTLVVPLPQGVTFTVVMDCCHSGTVFDLPYCIKADDATMQTMESGTVPEMEQNPSFSFKRLLSIGKKLAAMHMAGASPQTIAMMGLKEVGGAGGAMKLAQQAMGSLSGGSGTKTASTGNGTKSATGGALSSIQGALLKADPSIDKNKDGKISAGEAKEAATDVLEKVMGKQQARKLTSCCILQ